MTDDSLLRDILTRYHRIAVVGMSKNPEKEAHTVPEYLIEQGYEVIPVNPTATEILGRIAFPTLSAVLGGYDIIDVFRPSADVPAVVLNQVEDATIRDSKAAEGTSVFLGVKGNKTRGVRLVGNDLVKAKVPYRVDSEVKGDEVKSLNNISR